MTTKTNRSAPGADAASGEVEEAAAVLLEARRVLAEWERRLAESTGRVAELEAETGAEFLDDASAADSWPDQLRQARDAVAAASRAVGAQAERVEAAERGWCAAQAVVVEQQEVAPARERLTAHRARTEVLLEQLAEHEGPYVPQRDLAAAQRGFSQSLTEDAVEAVVPKCHALEVAVVVAETRRDVLVAMAAGRDPQPAVREAAALVGVAEVELYPEVVRPGGLVLAGAFAAKVARVKTTVREMEAAVEELTRELDELPERAMREQWPDLVLERALERRRVRLEELPGEIAAARVELAVLAG